MQPTLQDILAARGRIVDFARATGVVALPGFSDVLLKAECLQRTGSFKVRGAYNRIAQLTDEERARGVVAASAGNHAQGVALAARELGAQATIVMPANAPLQKIANTRALGAQVVLHGSLYDDAHERARQLQREGGANFIDAFNDAQIIAGQGTLGLEILEQAPDIDCVLAAVGGGGMIAGLAVAIKALRPDIEVYGVEPECAASMTRSLREGRIVSLASADTIADGVAVKTPGELPFALCQKLLDGMFTVTEDEIAAAILYLMERAKMVAEGAGALPVAVAMRDEARLAGKKTLCVVSGGNIDVTMLANTIERGLIKTGRRVTIDTTVPDRPGRLARVLDIVARTGANIEEVAHSRTRLDVPMGIVRIGMTLGTSGPEHVQRVVRALEEAGFGVEIAQ